MKQLQIYKYPHEYLKTKSTTIVEFNEELRSLSLNMLNIMHEHNGIGLAANQVGILKQILVINVDIGRNRSMDRIFINPSIISSQDKTMGLEGCLSFPTIQHVIERNKTIEVEFFNLAGVLQKEKFDGIMAICLQHEIDHLNGIIYPERLSKLKKDRLLEKYKKNTKQKFNK